MGMFVALQHMIFYTVIGVCIITIPTLIVGIVISIFQAATQINEMTLTFIPKFLTVLGIIYVLSPWFMSKLIAITQEYMTHLSEYVR